MLATLVTLAVKFGLGGIIDKTIALLDHRAELDVDKEKLRTELAAEHLRQIVEETRLMVDFNKAKMANSIFWWLIVGFAGGLCVWWNAVILDSIFHFGWNVANLPTMQMQMWAGDMIKWLFYVGSGVAAYKMISR